MAEQFIFTMHGLNKFYGQKQVLKDIYLSFYPGAKIGIVGENGSGKSTVLKIMAGVDDRFQGKAEPSKGVRVGYVPQEPALDENATVREEVEKAFAKIVAALKEYDEVTMKMAEVTDDAEMDRLNNRMAELQDQIDAMDGWNLDHHINVAAEALMLPDNEQKIGTLSGGEKRRVALCKTLLDRPDLLLLDEPTNHLDAETVDWLEQQLKDYPGTVIIVTHDRYFLDNITKWILELEGGHGLPFEGNYTSWLGQKIEKLAQQEKKDSPRRRQLERELTWIKMNDGEKQELSRSRVSQYEQLLAKEAATSKEDSTVIAIAPATHLGDKVIEFKEVTKGYGGDPLLKNVSFNIPRGAIVGVIGPNGAGKTTLFKMILGQEKPDSGEIEIGSTVQFGYVDQNRSQLAGDKTAVDDIGEGNADIVFGKQSIPVRAYLSRFGFKGVDQQKPISAFSGGERNRLNLAKLLKNPGNVLLLDEPTNDLDVNTLRMLEEALLAYSGCALVISHDRFFLNRVCTHLLVFEGEGKVRWFEGNYEQYEAKHLAETGGNPFVNRRSRYRKLLAN